MQTSIDTFFRNRKRSANELLAPTKSITRKLFAQDDGPSSPIRSPVIRHEDSSEEQNSPEPVQEAHVEGTERTITTPTRSAAEQKRLQEELNLGPFKKCVRHSKKYTTLKAALEKHNATVSRLEKIEQAKKDLTSSPELKRFSHVEFEVESSPIKQGTLKPRKLFGSSSTGSPAKNLSYVSPRKFLDEGPVESPTKPAFDKYRQLIVDGKDLLVLPPKYVTLKEIFNGIENVIKILTDNRKAITTFNCIQNNVQKMIRKKFTEQHLAMIKTVYPDAYELKYELIKLPFSSNETLELIINKTKSSCVSTNERKNMFHNLLLERTKLHHQEFLQTLDPPLVVPMDQMKRWHPSFDLNSVPDIPPASIPRPSFSKDAPAAVKDYLEKTKQLVSCNKRMDRAVSQLIKKCDKPEVEKNTESTKGSATVTSPAANPIPALQKALKGVPKSLLEKIRAKKAAKMVAEITQTPEKAKEQVMLSRLPELAKIMRVVFVKEGKKVLPEDSVLPKVSLSFKEKMSTADLVEHLKLISEKCPGWMSFFTVHNVKYVRLEKDADITRIVGKLQNLAQIN